MMVSRIWGNCSAGETIYKDIKSETHSATCNYMARPMEKEISACRRENPIHDVPCCKVGLLHEDQTQTVI